MPTIVPIEDRFLAKVAFGPGCWLWLGALDTGGYANINTGPRPAKAIKAHRFAYEFWVGPIPEGLVIDHLCRVRHCVRPSHLEPVTQTLNIQRGISPQAINGRKTHCVNGHEFAEGSFWAADKGKGRKCKQCHRNRMGAKKSGNTNQSSGGCA